MKLRCTGYKTISFFKKVFLASLTAWVLFSCEKSDPTAKGRNDPEQYSYSLKHITSVTPVDINNDGEFNTDLTKEESKFMDRKIFVQKRDNGPLFILSWLEPQINRGPMFVPLPDRYTQGMEIIYQPVFMHYYFSYGNNKKSIHIGEPWMDDKLVFTFEMPKTISVRNNGQELFLESKQTFIHNEGKKQVLLNAVFEADDRNDVIK